MVKSITLYYTPIPHFTKNKSNKFFIQYGPSIKNVKMEFCFVLHVYESLHRKNEIFQGRGGGIVEESLIIVKSMDFEK